MTIAFAAVLLPFVLTPQSPMRPSRKGESPDEVVAAIVDRIGKAQPRDRGDHIAELQGIGLYGVQWLVEKAVSAGPDDPYTNMLVWFQPKDERIAEQLLPRLLDSDEQKRIWWAVALANVTPPAVDVLIREFESEEHARKLAAVRAARAFCEHYEIVAPKLAPLVDDADADVRYWAAFSLGGLAPASLPALFHALSSKDARVRAAAAESIQKSFYPYLTDRKSADWGGYSTWHGLPPGMESRELSNEIIARDGLAPLRAALKDDNEDVRFFAAMTLFELGSKAVAARPDLEAALSDASSGVRLWAARALERTDPTPWIRLKRLAIALRAKDTVPEALDGAALARLAADLDHEPPWAPIKEDKVLDRWSPERDVRFEAVRSITTRGLDGLLSRAASEDAQQSEPATRILAALERELDRRITQLIRIVDSPFGGGGPEAGALIELGSAAVPALEHALVRYPRFPMGCPTYYAIASLLTKLGEPAVPVAAVGLAHWHECGRIFSTQVLLAGGEKAAPLAPAIVSAWRTVGKDVRIPGTETRWDSKLERLCTGYSGPATTRGLKLLGPSALPTLIRVLDDPHAEVRMRAATSLGSFGKQGAPALAALVRRLGDDQRHVASAAADAILLIVPPESVEAEAARAKLAEIRVK